MIILGMDTGTKKSAYCAINGANLEPIAYGKIDNAELIKLAKEQYYDAMGIEGFACYGGRVGQEVFDSAYMVGRLQQLADDGGTPNYIVLRRHVKKCLLGKASGKDCNDKAIRQALIDKFGDWVKGMNNDERSAYAVAITLAKELEGV